MPASLNHVKQGRAAHRATLRDTIDPDRIGEASEDSGDEHDEEDELLRMIDDNNYIEPDARDTTADEHDLDRNLALPETTLIRHDIEKDNELAFCRDEITALKAKLTMYEQHDPDTAIDHMRLADVFGLASGEIFLKAMAAKIPTARQVLLDKAACCHETFKATIDSNLDVYKVPTKNRAPLEDPKVTAILQAVPSEELNEQLGLCYKATKGIQLAREQAPAIHHGGQIVLPRSIAQSPAHFQRYSGSNTATGDRTKLGGTKLGGLDGMFTKSIRNMTCLANSESFEDRDSATTRADKVEPRIEADGMVPIALMLHPGATSQLARHSI